MASLFDPPGLTASRESARRDASLLRRAYRDARRRGDNERAYGIAQRADAEGLPVGRTSHDEEIAGVGESRYFRGLQRAGIQPPGMGLDAYDHSQKGVGYDFRQAKDRPVAQSPLETYRQTYQSLGNDTDAQNSLIARANMEGIPLSDYGRQRLLRSSILTGRNSTYQPGTAMPEGSTVPKANPPITTPGQSVIPGTQNNAGVGQNFPALLSKNKAPSLLPPAQVGGAQFGGYSSDQGPVQDPYQRFKGPLLTADQQLSQIRNRMAPYAAASDAAMQRDSDAQASLDGYYSSRGTTQEDSLGDEGLLRQRQERLGRLALLRNRNRQSAMDNRSRIMEGEGDIDAMQNSLYGSMLLPRRDSSSAMDSMRRLRRLF